MRFETTDEEQNSVPDGCEHFAVGFDCAFCLARKKKNVVVVVVAALAAVNNTECQMDPLLKNPNAKWIQFLFWVGLIQKTEPMKN